MCTLYAVALNNNSAKPKQLETDPVSIAEGLIFQNQDFPNNEIKTITPLDGATTTLKRLKGTAFTMLNWLSCGLAYMGGKKVAVDGLHLDHII